MNLVSEIGDTVPKELSVEWKISDFSSLSDKVGDFYKSPAFIFADLSWHLELHPNGQTRNSSQGWVGFYLRKELDPPKTVYFTFGIKSSDGVEKIEETEAEFSTNVEAWGYPKCWSRTELKSRKSTLLPNNVLTLTCDLRSSKAPSAFKSEEKVIKALLNMMECGEDSDVVIKIQGKEFPAHRGILRARSPVFRSMFSHDMVEKLSNVVTIEDGDPETFPDFLAHIYSGSCEQISTQNVYSLYTAADKYDFCELKVECSKFMKSNITVACFGDVITLAVKHDDKELIEWAANFFCDNTVDIAKTASWQTFLKENSTIGNELFIKACILSK